MAASVLWTSGLLGLSHLLFVFASSKHRSLLDVRPHAMLIAGVLLMAAGALFLRSGVSRLEQLRFRLAALRAGRISRIDGRYPAEVQPLVDDLNALLEQREDAVRGAIARAGDLAHGLKTPLAVLAQEAERPTGHPGALRLVVAQQVERMRRQIDYHLAHARASAAGATPGTRSDVAVSVDAVAGVLRKLHDERGLLIENRVAAGLEVRVRVEDLEEMLGNLLENACRYARRRVTVSATWELDRAIIEVADDGPGLTPAMREVVLQRGVRADETAPGSGFGLAIVSDLARVYGGAIALRDSQLGGLCAELRLPIA